MNLFYLSLFFLLHVFSQLINPTCCSFLLLMSVLFPQMVRFCWGSCQSFHTLLHAETNTHIYCTLTFVFHVPLERTVQVAVNKNTKFILQKNNRLGCIAKVFINLTCSFKCIFWGYLDNSSFTSRCSAEWRSGQCRLGERR